MKKRILRLTLLGGCICLLLLAAMRFGGTRQFEEISLEKLERLLQQREDSIILCTQDLCPGCADAERFLKEVSGKAPYKIYTFDINTQDGKELLYQYGLLQVPAVIVIANDQVNIYKGAVSKENIERAITTEYVIYDRFDSITGIDYGQFLDKVNKNFDFFVLFGNDSCTDCMTFGLVLEQYIQRHSGAGMYCCDIGKTKSTIAAEEYNQFLKKYDIQWIPTVVHVKNGVELSRYEYPDSKYRQGQDTGAGSAAAADFSNWFDNELKK